MILNYCGSKSKTSPSGSRIYLLSQNVETLLNKASASDEAVSLCLPILMKAILKADFKLRELISKSGQSKGRESYLINYERALAIQKTVNTLFLNFFNAWVKTDTIAKKFLTELNGFDFLLDRLFAKSEDIPKVIEEEKKEQPLEAPA